MQYIYILNDSHPASCVRTTEVHLFIYICMYIIYIYTKIYVKIYVYIYISYNTLITASPSRKRYFEISATSLPFNQSPVERAPPHYRQVLQSKLPR